MSLDKSLKLLNIARDNSGNLQLFTELDHSFVVGDKLFINGGHYDNCEKLLHIQEFDSINNNFNPFKINSTGYIVLSVNYSNNSFTIKYPITSLIYPYGTELNPYGNSKDFINLAYNSYTDVDLFKNVYVSRVAFVNGNLLKGVINNGIFGTDNHKVFLNNRQVSTSVLNDLTINHIAGKNIEISKGIINDKLDPLIPVSTKFEMIEDSTALPFPHTLNQIVTSTNNDGWGYSTFERFTHTSQITINNGTFNNPYNDRIKLFPTATINKAKLGSLEPLYNNGNNYYNVILKGGELNICSNPNNNSLITVESGLYNTLIPMYGTELEWTAIPKTIKFKVAYNTIANKYWQTGKNVYISGINNITTNDYHFLNTNLKGIITGVDYIYGDINSAFIEINFPNITTPQWNNLILDDVVNYDISNMKLSIINNQIDKLHIKNANIKGYFNGSNDIYFYESCIVNEGSLENIIFQNSVNFFGESKWNNIYIGSEILQNIIGIARPKIFNSFINIKYSLKGEFKFCKIIQGTIYDSIISDTVAISTGNNTVYLNDVVLNDGSKIDSSVIWNNVNVNFYGDIIESNVIVNKSYLGDRKTPWKTELTGVAPLLPSEYSTEINKVEAISGSDIAYYTSRHKIINLTSITGVPLYKIIYEAPIIKGAVNAIINLNEIHKAVIIDNGPMYYTSVWNNTLPFKKRVLHAGVTFNNASILNPIKDRFNNTVTPAQIQFPGVALPPTYASDIVGVDDLWLISDKYNYPNEPDNQRDITIHRHLIYNRLANFPSSLMNDPLAVMFLKIIPVTGPIYEVYHNGPTTTLSNGLKTINFRQPGSYFSSGTVNKVVSCFIEIEQVNIVKKDLSNNIIESTINICNYSPPYVGSGGNEYTWDNSTNIANYPTDFPILDKDGNLVSFDVTLTDIIDVDVEFWVTWFYNDTGLNSSTENPTNLKVTSRSGERTKHTIKHTFNSDGQTYYIIGDGGDYLIDDSGDRLIWI